MYVMQAYIHTLHLHTFMRLWEEKSLPKSCVANDQNCLQPYHCPKTDLNTHDSDESHFNRPIPLSRGRSFDLSFFRNIFILLSNSIANILKVYRK